MACPEDYIRADYKHAPVAKYPRRHAFFAHVTKSCYQSSYRNDIGSFFNLDEQLLKTKKLMQKRAEKWTSTAPGGSSAAAHLAREAAALADQNVLDQFAVKYTGPDKKLRNSRSEPRLTSEYRDKLRGRQHGFS
mmetsp:Transcript_12134/g.29427  ORF Transcript_12134/g.29427 Transcript_12134/m.29427 type:complete len:134 (+) Transcript_12134:168-569(+)